MAMEEKYCSLVFRCPLKSNLTLKYIFSLTYTEICDPLDSVFFTDLIAVNINSDSFMLDLCRTIHVHWVTM